jgi:hypothetical protein
MNAPHGFALWSRCTDSIFPPLKETSVSSATITITLIVLVILMIGAMPTWAHSRNWGYVPSGGLGLIAFGVLVMLATGQL